MTKIVEVRTGARLHFGLFATTPGDGPFGGIGMMIERPGFVVQSWRSTRDKVHAPGELAGRIHEIVVRVRHGLCNPELRLQSDEPWAPVTIQVNEVIPAHRGFGSGTQLTFAVSTAMMYAFGVWPPVSPDDQLGRGGRSAVGTVGFRDGGFLVDAGVRHRQGLEPGITRRDVPDEWRFVVIEPQGPPGPSGTAETAGFQALPQMPRRMPSLLFDLVTEAILPGLEGRDFNRFASGVTDFNRLVGEHFAPAQGGVYAHPLIRDLAQRLRETHWRHLAQSSWGPAAVVICEDESSANALATFLSRSIPHDAANVFVARPLNRGAEIKHL